MDIISLRCVNMEKKYKWLLAGITGTAGLFFGSRMLVHQLVKGIGTIFTTDPYQGNIAEALSAGYRVGAQTIWETNLRAESGQVISRPLGSPRKVLDFNGLAFSPVFLSRLPTPLSTKIETKTIIGKK